MAPTAVESTPLLSAGVNGDLDASLKRRSVSPSAQQTHEERNGSASPTPVASTSKRTLEESEDEEYAALFPTHAHTRHSQPKAYKKRVWVPTKHLTEAACPPQPDPKTVAEMQAQQAATALGYEGRRIKKFMQRRTVDYWGSYVRFRHRYLSTTCERPQDKFDTGLYPSPHQIVKLLPSAAYTDVSTSVTNVLVHTSTNKIRCPINVVKWMPDGRRVLTGSTSGEFTLWNGLTFNFETIMQAHDSAVRSFAWSKSGNYLISCDQNGTIKYFQNNLNTLQAFQGHSDSVRSLSWCPDDTKFVSGGDDSVLKIWDFDSAKQISTVEGHGWDVKCVDWHPTKGLLVSGSKDNLVKFWDPRSRTCLATFHGHKNTVQSCKFGPDSNLVATASRDQTVKVYDLRSMNELVTLKGHNKEVCSVEFHPVHHNVLVSGGSEGSLLTWDLTAACNTTSSLHRQQLTLEGEAKSDSHTGLLDRMDTAHESNIWSLAYHPLGHILCSGSNDHMTRFWSRARPHSASAQMEADRYAALNKSFGAGGGFDMDDDFVIPGLGRSFIPSLNSAAASGPSASGSGAATLADSSSAQIQPAAFGNIDDDFIPGLSRNLAPSGSGGQPAFPTSLAPYGQQQQSRYPPPSAAPSGPSQPTNQAFGTSTNRLGNLAAGWPRRAPDSQPGQPQQQQQQQQQKPGGTYGSLY